MANKRDFKKYVDAIGGSIYTEFSTVLYENPKGLDKETLMQAIHTLLKAVGEARNNSNVFFDKGAKAFENRGAYEKAKRAFFKNLFDKINTEFSAGVEEAVKLFNKSVPEEVKKQNIA